jgi:rod shape-determining protein MreC
VFVEIREDKAVESQSGVKDNVNNKTLLSNTEKIKLDIINEENRILNETNSKFLEENQLLKFQSNNLNNKIFTLQKKLEIKMNEVNQNTTDQEELAFLRLNLIHSSKCKRSAFKKGYKVGTPEYKECILRKGKKN